MSEPIVQTVRIEGQDAASEAITKVNAALKALTTELKEAQATMAATGRAWAADLDRMAANAKAASGAATRAFQDLQQGITAETRSIRATLGTTFAPVEESAAVATKAAGSSMTKLTSTVRAEADALRATVADAFDPLAAGATAASSAVVTDMGRIDAAIGSSIAQVRALAAEMKALAVPVPAGVPGGRNAKLRRPHRGGTGPHFRPEGIKAPGGHVSLGSTPVMAGAAVAGYSVWEAMKTQDEALRLALTAQVNPADLAMSAQDYQREIMSGSALTGASSEDVADAYSRAIRGMQGVDPTKRIALIRKLLPTALAESKLKGAPLGETLQSFIELGHMTNTYDPDELKRISGKTAIASLSVNSTLPEFTKTLSYSLPVLHAGIGVDEDTLIALTAAMQNAGINSTKSGTWIRSFYEGLLPKAHARPGDKHNLALAQLGLGSPSTWQVRGKDGRIDWSASTDRASSIMRERTAGMNESQRATALKDAFGERGAGVAALMTKESVQEQFNGIRKKISVGGDMDLFGEYAENSSLMQSQKAWRDLQNVLIDLGTTALPTVTAALEAFDKILKQLPQDWADTKKLWSDRFDTLKHFFGAALPDDRAERAKPDDAAPKPWWRRATDWAIDHQVAPMAYRDGGAGTLDDGVERSPSTPVSTMATWAPVLRLWQLLFEDVHAIRDLIEAKAKSAISDQGGILKTAYEAGQMGSSGGISANGEVFGLRGRRMAGGGGDYLHGPLGPAFGGAGKTFAAKAPVIMGKLMGEFGLTRDQAAGIVGNLGHESAGFTAYQEDGKRFGTGGAGWAQWTGSRRRQFENFAREHGLDPRSDEASWQFLAHGDPEFKKALAAVRMTHDRHAATVAFEQAFERAGVKAYRSRFGFADKAAELGPDTAAQVAKAAMTPKVAAPPKPEAPAPTTPAETASRLQSARPARSGDTHSHTYHIQAYDPRGVAREIEAINGWGRRHSPIDSDFG